jgi:hypothetical protein
MSCAPRPAMGHVSDDADVQIAQIVPGDNIGIKFHCFDSPRHGYRSSGRTRSAGHRPPCISHCATA